MKASFNMPSGNYVLTLSNKELEELLTRGSINKTVSRIPHTAGRIALNREGTDLEVIERKEVYASISFNLSEQIADCPPETYNIQFLNIVLEKE